MAWKLLLTWITRFRNFFRTGIIHDFMESSHRQKELVRNAKIKRVVKEIDFSLRPFKLRIRKVIVYDDFDKIVVRNKQIDITLDRKVPYNKKQ